MKLSTAVSFLSSAMALSATSVVIAAPMGTGRIIMTNLAPNQGIFFTPFWVAIHDGNFDIYDRDMPASMELERLAEDGTTGDISALFDAGNTAGNVFDATIANPPPFPGPIAPGATVELEFTLTADDIDENLYFSYASMIVPSNDAFVANGDPRAHLIYSEEEGFRSIDFNVPIINVLDAGTEVNDEIAANTAFLLQAGPDIGVPEGGVILQHPGFGNGPGFAGPSVTSYGAHGNGDFTNAMLYPNGVLRIQVVFDARGPAKKKKGKGKKGAKSDSSRRERILRRTVRGGN